MDTGPINRVVVRSETTEGEWSGQFGIPGLDGTPYSAIFFGRDLIVGGNFHHADGIATSGVARWGELQDNVRGIRLRRGGLAARADDDGEEG